MKIFYIDKHIYDGINDPKRFPVTVFHKIFLGILVIYVILSAAINSFYLLLKVDFLPGHFRTMVIVFAFGLIWAFSIKNDIILAQVKLNLSPLKVFYFLINNIKSKHKLTDLNYNRLAILSQINCIKWQSESESNIPFGSYVR